MAYLVKCFHTLAALHKLAPLGAILTSILCASCSSGPAPVYGPDIDPSAAGSAAVEQYDTSGDGTISAEELAKSPALTAAIKRIDTNGDGGASAEEIAERIEKWRDTKVGLMSAPFTVTLDGRPLPGATATFEPEEFLANQLVAAECVTNDFGGGSGSIPKDQRPDPTLSGMYLGLYKVKISKNVNGSETIPAKYNAKTVLGQEIAPDVAEILNNRVVYTLTSK